MINNYVNIDNEILILNERKKDINEEIRHIDKILEIKENTKKIIASHLKELDGIENKLYYQIVVLGKNVTQAVDKVAFDCDKDVSTIWKNYYPNVKNKIKELKL
ncbi:MAG TPA: hypothetical protein IAB65_05825 [Candidatus Onthocola stercorigallinarum]|nr:hypothetical protein [Candidatus Onthocola stercorigallinarum]